MVAMVVMEVMVVKLLTMTMTVEGGDRDWRW
jgi:hypothetical protein